MVPMFTKVCQCDLHWTLNVYIWWTNLTFSLTRVGVNFRLIYWHDRGIKHEITPLKNFQGQTSGCQVYAAINPVC